MAHRLARLAALAALGTGAAATGYLGLVTAAVPIDLGIGRRTRALGPHSIDIAAPRDMVFAVIAQPYLSRTTQAMAEKIHILERGSDMVLAAHHTPLRGHLVATTVETVRFTRPDRIDFHLVRGPVPHVTESFLLTDYEHGTRLHYRGELGTDLWALGQHWGNIVARHWEATVAASLALVKTEAERRARRAGS